MMRLPGSIRLLLIGGTLGCIVATICVVDVSREPHGYVAGYAVAAVYVWAAAGLVIALILALFRRTRRGGVLIGVAAVVLLPFFFLGLSIASRFDLIASNHEKMVRFGLDVPASLVIYFNPGVSSAEIEQFSSTILHRPYVPGYGQDLAPGICSYLRVGGFQSAHGLEGIAISFCNSSSSGQRDTLKANVEASPLVYGMYENVAPDQVRMPR
jgi:hypothetical protein